MKIFVVLVALCATLSAQAFNGGDTTVVIIKTETSRSEVRLSEQAATTSQTYTTSTTSKSIARCAWPYISVNAGYGFGLGQTASNQGAQFSGEAGVIFNWLHGAVKFSTGSRELVEGQKINSHQAMAKLGVLLVPTKSFNLIAGGMAGYSWNKLDTEERLGEDFRWVTSGNAFTYGGYIEGAFSLSKQLWLMVGAEVTTFKVDYLAHTTTVENGVAGPTSTSSSKISCPMGSLYLGLRFHF